jgi:hypothetical protein
VNIPEGKEWIEAKASGRVSILKGVPDHHPVVRFGKDHLLTEQYPTYPVNEIRDGLSVEIPDILMSARLINPAGIFVNAKVKARFTLDDHLIKIRQKHMVLIVDARLGGYQQSMVFAGIAPNNGTAGIGSGPVRTQELPLKGISQVYQLIFIKFYITHL